MAAFPGRISAIGTLAAAVYAVGCASAASVLLDLPEKSSPPTAAARPAPASSLAEDTARPPIELIRNPDSVLALLPRDSGGNIDWVAALHNKVITPRAQLPGGAWVADMSGFRFDIVLKGPDESFNAVFPHSSHVEWLDCRSCHSAIFPYPPAPISMGEISEGKACGVCHGPVAFSADACFRCHPAMPPSDKVTPSFGRDVIVLARAPDSVSAGADQFPRARFSHSVHRLRYRCMACHPAPFQAKAGADTLKMAGMERGTACGACHNGSNAFPVYDCQRCHASPEGKGKPGG